MSDKSLQVDNEAFFIKNEKNGRASSQTYPFHYKIKNENKQHIVINLYFN